MEMRVSAMWNQEKRILEWVPHSEKAVQVRKAGELDEIKEVII